MSGRLWTRVLLLAALMTLITLAIGIGASILITHFDLYDITADMPVQRWQEIESLIRADPVARGRFEAIFAHYADNDLRAQDWYFIIGVALASSLIGGAFAYVFARWLSRPITAVADASALVAAGETDVRVPRLGATGELRALVDSFNAMAGAIDVYQRERSILTAGIAHELRTPLTVLRGRLHGLIDGVIDMSDEEAGRLLRQVDRLARVVEDLRTLAHSESQALALELRFVPALEAARQVAADLEPLAAEAGVQVQVAGDDIVVRADALRISQALTNIVMNAIRHAPAGSIVQIAVQVVPDAVEFVVTDPGPGFPDNDREQLFAPFWRASSRANASASGSGIGLNIALKIAQAHGGTITAANRDGRAGAEFTLRLPRR